MKKPMHNGFVHVGLDEILPKQDIIGLFDIDSLTVQKNSREYLNGAQKNKEIEDISTDLPISFILCDSKTKKQRIIFSSFSLPTLKARVKRKFP